MNDTWHASRSSSETCRILGRRLRRAAPRLLTPQGLAPLVWCALLSASGCSQISDVEEAVAPSQQAIESAPLALSNGEKQTLILDVLEKFVPFAESFYRASDISEPQTGRYDAVGSGVTQPRGAGDIAFAYVTLLEAYPDRTSFGGVSREVMIDHTIQSIRHEAFTNALSGTSYKRWGGGTWQASLETYSWAFAAYKLWAQLDQETRALVKKVVTAEANILITKALASGEEGDTGAEDNAWNSPTPALARVMFPEEANAEAWDRAAKRLAINASSTTADATNETLVDGIAVREWMGSVNLHPDLTLENHGFFNPIYQQVTFVDINDAALTYGQAGLPIPEAFSFRMAEIWDGVLKRLASDEGDFIMPAGQDWTSKDFQHLDYLGALATRLQRADASVFESRALELVAKRQATRTTGSILGYTQIGYETMLVKRLAALWWTHEVFAPSPVPTQAEFADLRAQASGVKSYPYSDFIAARLGQAFVSMSWDPSKPMGLVVPHSEAYAQDPLFTYYAPKSLVGSASGTIGAHSSEEWNNGFSTAGSIGARRFSMTAFADGTTMLLDRGEGATFTYALESIAGLTGARPIYSQNSEGAGSLAGNWVNAADRLGMIVRGGAGIATSTVTSTNNQLVITGSTGTGSGNRGALLLPNVGHEKTQELEAYVSQLETPSDWSALVARASDNSARLAMARWNGVPMANLELTDERGAPVPEEDATLSGHTATFVTHLGLPDSHGETLRFFVDSTTTLHGQQSDENVAVLRNPTDTDATVTVTYAGPSGETATQQRVIESGEETRARLVAGDLTLAGAEFEPLMSAKVALSSIEDALPDAPCRGRHPHHAKRHGRTPFADCHANQSLQVALDAVGRAMAESDSVAPNARRLAWAIAKARWAVKRLEHDLKHSSVEVASQVANVKTKLHEAAAASQAITTWVTANGLAQPGEPLELTVNVLNRGMRPIRNGSVSISTPDNVITSSTTALFEELLPGEAKQLTVSVTIPASATVGDVTEFAAQLSYQMGHHDGVVVADVEVPIDPVMTVVSTASNIPLGLGGWNLAPLRLTNLTARALDVTLDANSTAGTSVQNTTQLITVPAQGSTDLTVLLRDLTLASGSGQLDLVARTANGASVTTNVPLSFSDDLARNTVAAPWPLSSASSNQSAYPPSLAFDGNASTFWVSGGTVAGEGPTPTNPQYLNVDFGVAQRIGAISMVPRTNYGPKAYTIEVSSDASQWTQVASVPSAANATINTTITPVEARYLRLNMTGGWDRIQPPRNVQVASLIVKAAQ